MLILHRKRHEAIRIGEHIRVVVLEAEAGGARLGIDAPRNVSILREEIVKQVEDENLLASRATLVPVGGTSLSDLPVTNE
jgi:carbon storage regulator